MFRNALSLRLKDLMNPTAEVNSELLFSLNAHTPVSLPSPEQLTYLSFCQTISSDHKAHSSGLPSSSHPHFTSLSLTTQLFSLSQSSVFLNHHPECSTKSGASQVGSPLLRHLLFLAHVKPSGNNHKTEGRRPCGEKEEEVQVHCVLKGTDTSSRGLLLLMMKFCVQRKWKD